MSDVLYYDDANKILYAKCVECGKFVGMKCTEEQKEKYLKRQIPIQDIFPEVSPGIRETFISGLCNECFESIFEGFEE